MEKKTQKTTVKTVPKSKSYMVERVIIDTPNTQIHGHSLSWLGTGTSINSDRVELVLWAQTFPLSEMMGTKSHFILCIKFEHYCLFVLFF